MPNYQFFIKKGPNHSGPMPLKGNAWFVLSRKTWDDFGSKSLYSLEYRNDKGQHPIGDIKIISREKETATPPEHFTSLSDEFISLGQDLKFYEHARLVLGANAAEAALSDLNDIALQKGKGDPFEHLLRYSNSLLRSNDAQRALLYGRKTLEKKPIPSDYSFTYKCQIPGADSSFEIAFDFKKELLPSRIHAVIGRNGVGKTAFLARLAMDLATPGKESLEKRQERDDAFVGDRPLFSRVIAVSLSAFDEFKRPQESEYISYVYCGVKDDENRVTKSRLKNRLAGFVKRIQDNKRQSSWIGFLKQIVGTDANIDAFSKLMSQDADDQTSAETIVLSSGQNTLIYCVSAIVAYAKPGALILFDEPELHLHPNALSQLIAILYEVLREYDSYAILATHSALVLQEIPRKRVTLLKRNGNLTQQYPLSKETFGEDIAPLTEMVFETVNVDNHYKEVLQLLAAKKSFEEVEALFDNKLSPNALAYLAALYDVKLPGAKQ